MAWSSSSTTSTCPWGNRRVSVASLNRRRWRRTSVPRCVALRSCHSDGLVDCEAMRIGHVRERVGPAGAPWRLAAAATWDAGPWLDLEVVRRRLVAADARRAHNEMLFRQPLSTLDDVLARGLRLEALRDLLEGFAASGGPRDADDAAVLDEADLFFGPPVLRPPAFRDFYAFEQHVATMWGRRGSEIPEAWYRLPIFYFSNTSEIRGPGEAVWAPRGSLELDFELELGAIVDTPAFDLHEERAAEA